MMEKRFWKRGAGEFVGYTITVVFLVYIFLLGLSAVILNKNIRLLEQSAQRAARECVTAHSLSDASKIAEKTARSLLEGQSGITDIETSVIPVPISDEEWKKGNYIYVTVSAYIRTTDPLTSGRRDSVVMIMIEHNEDTEADPRL